MNGWQWATIAFSAAVLLGIIVVIATVPAATKGEVRLCDKAVSTLLGTPDPVELRRANIIVRHLRCGIGFRLDDAGEFTSSAVVGSTEGRTVKREHLLAREVAVAEAMAPRS